MHVSNLGVHWSLLGCVRRKILIQKVWGGAWDPAFPASSPVGLTSPIPRPHFEQQVVRTCPQVCTHTQATAAVALGPGLNCRVHPLPFQLCPTPRCPQISTGAWTCPCKGGDSAQGWTLPVGLPTDPATSREQKGINRDGCVWYRRPRDLLFIVKDQETNSGNAVYKCRGATRRGGLEETR